MANSKLSEIKNKLLILIFSIEIISLIYINFFPANNYIDYDYAKLLRHALEMGNNHSFLLADWNYITTAEFDCSALFATIIYMVIGNINVSFVIANVINIAIWALVIWALLAKVKISQDFKLLCLIVIYGIYDFGMLSYTNMMFFCGGQYVYKSLIPLMLVSLLLTAKDDIKSVANIILDIAFVILLFISSVSSGVYVFICGIAPIIICQIIFALKTKNIDKYKVAMLGLSFITSIMGVLTCKVLNVSPDSSSVVLRYTDDFLDTFIAECNDFIQLFNPFISEGAAAVSVTGIATVFRWMILVVIFMGLLELPKAFGIQTLKKNNIIGITDDYEFNSMLISIFAWNFVILYLTMSTPRYHLIGAVPLMILGVLRLQKLLEDYESWVRSLVMYVIVFALLIININSVTVGRQNYYSANYSSYADDKFDMANCNKLIELLDAHDATTMFFVNIYALPELMRGLDDTHTYESYNTYTGEVLNYDFYYADRDRGIFSDHNIMVVSDEDAKLLPAYISGNYKLIERIDNYNILYSENNPIDGITYIKEGIQTVDLATTPGYTVEGEIDGKGYLHSNAAEPLSSRDIYVNGKYSLTINFETQGDSTNLDIYMNSEKVESLPLSAGSNSVNYQSSSGGVLKFVVNNENNEEITIKEILFN